MFSVVLLATMFISKSFTYLKRTTVGSHSSPLEASRHTLHFGLLELSLSGLDLIVEVARKQLNTVFSAFYESPTANFLRAAIAAFPVNSCGSTLLTSLAVGCAMSLRTVLKEDFEV